ncbi:MAG TPA: SPOR domain-containing protein [Bacteroidales bacterium]|nr:SPOR domain-containing protein [Bacteroidales bacterium]
MHRLALLLVIALISTNVFGQKGYVRVSAPPQFDTLLKISRINPQLQPIEGFRIQIFIESGNMAVERAQAAMARYQESFPEDKAYLSFGQPYYRVRVGDFRTRLEAEGKLQQVTRIFSQAFVIKDIIEPPPLPAFTNQNQQP